MTTSELVSALRDVACRRPVDVADVADRLGDGGEACLYDEASREMLDVRAEVAETDLSTYGWRRTLDVASVPASPAYAASVALAHGDTDDVGREFVGCMGWVGRDLDPLPDDLSAHLAAGLVRPLLGPDGVLALWLEGERDWALSVLAYGTTGPDGGDAGAAEDDGERVSDDPASDWQGPGWYTIEYDDGTPAWTNDGAVRITRRDGWDDAGAGLAERMRDAASTPGPDGVCHVPHAVWHRDGELPVEDLRLAPGMPDPVPVDAGCLPPSTFAYGGHHYRLTDTVLPETLSECSRHLRSTGTLGHGGCGPARNPDGTPWDHGEFYDAATGAYLDDGDGVAYAYGATADVFECLETGRLVCPGTNELFEWIG